MQRAHRRDQQWDMVVLQRSAQWRRPHPHYCFKCISVAKFTAVNQITRCDLDRLQFFKCRFKMKMQEYGCSCSWENRTGLNPLPLTGRYLHHRESTRWRQCHVWAEQWSTRGWHNKLTTHYQININNNSRVTWYPVKPPSTTVWGNRFLCTALWIFAHKDGKIFVPAVHSNQGGLKDYRPNINWIFLPFTFQK